MGQLGTGNTTPAASAVPAPVASSLGSNTAASLTTSDGVRLILQPVTPVATGSVTGTSSTAASDSTRKRKRTGAQASAATKK